MKDTITIIGGQRKWYEPVIKKMGCELAHDGGEHPQRIFSLLRRSKVLFLITTATSHTASKQCVKIAKEYGIPFYTIQGSKTNLRGLLKQIH